MTTDAERAHEEQAERRRRLAAAYATTFGVGDGPAVLADLQAHTAGPPGLKAMERATTSAGFTYLAGFHEGARDLVERIAALVTEGQQAGAMGPQAGRQTEAVG